MKYINDNICAIATGSVSSGISIIRISGNDAFNIADKIFVSKTNKKLTNQKTQTIHYGHIVSQGEIYDEVLVSVFKAPNSYTAENVVEINCHGGIIVTRKILELCLVNGCRLAEPGEFTKRAFLNGRIDLSQAEAVIDLINASNEDAARNSVDMLNGKLTEEIKLLRDKIIRDTAFIEAALDDPEHIEIDGFADILSENVKAEISKISKLIKSYDDGVIIRDGIKTVILGKPNAGKSTLLNTLTHTNRAIVTDIPGTTRDVLTESVKLNGFSLVLVDTAGIRETDDLVEKIGVERSVEELNKADLILYVADSTCKLDENDEKIINLLNGRKAIILLNKTDEEGILTIDELKEKTGRDVIAISAKEETGIDKLSDCISSMFFDGSIGKNEEIYITRLRHKELLDAAFYSLCKVIDSIDMNMPEDFFTIDLMAAYAALGEIIGEEIADDLADRIFKEFCMGK